MQQGETFCEFYDFYRLVKVQKYAKRYKRNDIRKDDKKRKKLRDPLVIGKKNFVLAERLNKKDTPSVFYNSATDNKPFFNRDEIFLIRRIAFIEIKN